MEVKQVIVVRKDLNMSIGKTASQVAHASLAAITNFMVKERILLESGGFLTKRTMEYYDNEALYKWLDTGSFTKIILGCENEQELFELHEEAVQNNLVHAMIIDDGRTEFDNVQTPTTLSIGPDYNHVIDEITGHLELL